MRAVVDVISALEKTTVTKEVLEVMSKEIINNFIHYNYIVIICLPFILHHIYSS